ncbi:MAG TPA: uroporphyrinogen decarboxylase family protein [Phycisphaerae bacterium]|jgi:hypothetical protein|nr:hypothetical protein [Phycisphaerae bacterium]HOB73682.1 uroporphyrinogen decarboxylase family protein [Phycisphaerae bacterium]HOJ53444.1 uroporphyrinogen decarboxylase family protein [Phycisphaerae bacterium]HOL25432.1 uroporphyrinogen decarboxylase family protein [Phycisphaerae bacterium]HPP19891.1 uroporphyrinogen decarboxylase family protein [Phycisphaerae bacterium]
MYPDLSQLLDLLHIDAERLEAGRRRQAAIWRRQRPDRPPILLGRIESLQVTKRVGPQHLRNCEHQLRGGPPVPEYHQFDHYPMGEQFHDPRKMLIESLWDMIGWSRTPGDAQLSFRPNFGVGTLASIFGCKVHAPENDMPWVEEKPPRERLLDVDLDALDRIGLIPRVIEFIHLARETLKDFPQVHVFMPDLQGPMNTAFLLRGQDIFFDMADDPDYYHRLMEVVSEVYIRLSRRLKAELGEPLDGGWHGALYMEGGGARVVDDVSIMLSPAQYEEFSLPYVRKCLAPFGGGWVHSCGDISHQMQFYLDAPEIRGVNLGEPHYYDFATLLPRFAAADKFCYGGPVREPDEAVPAYLQRVAGYLKGAEMTLIFMPKCRGMEMTEGDWLPPEEMVQLWERYCRQ